LALRKLFLWYHAAAFIGTTFFGRAGLIFLDGGKRVLGRRSNLEGVPEEI
jgi:hypothetical protein